MSRGPGRIERAVEALLRDTDRSFSIDELAVIVYPGINTSQRKHRVSVLRTLNNISKRMLLWFYRVAQPGGRYFVSNGSNVRSYAHGLLRQSWWNAERSLVEIDAILADPEIQEVMSPGGLWWTDVEINKAENEQRQQTEILSPAALADLKAYRDDMGTFEYVMPAGYGYRSIRPPSENPHYLAALLGRFEPPGTPAFEYAMKLRARIGARADA
jgi:hypothetical protein